MRTFAYCRVSTTEQTTGNQVLAIINAGYNIEAQRVISEICSGSTPTEKRAKFKNLVDNKLESGDTLIVLKLDRLGRDNINVQQTIHQLINKGIKVICLDLPVADLSSSEGRLMLQMFSAFAEFERNRIIERTNEGLARAKAEGKKLGRPIATKTIKIVQDAKITGISQSKVAKATGLSTATVKRYWNKK
jgi:putative DNA-invertase from lambdoid prophage Rac